MAFEEPYLVDLVLSNVPTHAEIQKDLKSTPYISTSESGHDAPDKPIMSVEGVEDTRQVEGLIRSGIANTYAIRQHIRKERSRWRRSPASPAARVGRGPEALP